MLVELHREGSAENATEKDSQGVGQATNRNRAMWTRLDIQLYPLENQNLSEYIMFGCHHLKPRVATLSQVQTLPY